MDKHSEIYDYDVCLSFAGEDRDYVEKVASELCNYGIRVFYDKYEEILLWGKDLYVHLDNVYRNSAKYCVIFISRAYRDKLWSNHERQSAQARAFRENQEYLLPARFDDTEIPGLRDTIGYINLQGKSAIEFAGMIKAKIGKPIRENYFPRNPVGLFESLGAEDAEEKDKVYSCAFWFFTALQRMSNEEREVIFRLFMDGCPGDLPDNIHINQDLLSRVTGFSVKKLTNILGTLSSLGFLTTKHDEDEDVHLGHGKLFQTEWHDMRDDGLGNSTIIANEVISLVAMECCEFHGLEYLRRLDFSALSASNCIEKEYS